MLQALLSTATCYFAYRLALRLTGRKNAGLLAAFALAVSPAFIIEAAQILTETVYIFLVTGGIWLYIETLPSSDHQSSRRTLSLLILSAVLFGLATLTRAVLLIFPLGLAIHLLLVYGWRAGLKRAALFLLIYMLVVSTWTIYSLARWNRFVIAGEGLSAFLYIGATGWNGPQGTDQQLAEISPNLDYVEGAQAAIGKDPLGWVKHRIDELMSAYMQPHGTTFYPGASLRELALKWAREDRSLNGLIMLTQGNAFWSKLALYLLHYTALIAGAIGMWLYRRRWRIALPMLGLIAYVTLVHLALLALPRYLFPTEVFWWVFAAAAFSAGFARRHRDATM